MTNGKIPFPTQKEINMEIQSILQRALPPRKKFHVAFLALLKQVGWRYILPNRNEWLFSLFAVALFMVLAVSSLHAFSGDYVHRLIPYFIASPMLFASLVMFSFLEKREFATFELEMTMKYTVFQIIALRLVIFSSMAVIVNTTLTFIIASKLTLEFMPLWLTSLTSLLLYSVGLFYLLNTNRFLVKCLLYCVCWIVLHLVFVSLNRQVYLSVIFALPYWTYVILISFLIILCCRLFAKAFIQEQRELII